jgi:uncharacterized protein YceK
MRPSLNTIILVLAAVSLSGCGTVCNLAGGMLHPDSEPRVYGGVIRDVEIIDNVVSSESSESLLPINGGGGTGAAMMLAALISVPVVDPVLSLVADTLTLPVTIPLQERRIARQQEGSAPNQANAPTETNQPNVDSPGR